MCGIDGNRQNLAGANRRTGENYPWVQVFENKGAAMGCSNPHRTDRFGQIASCLTKLSAKTAAKRIFCRAEITNAGGLCSAELADGSRTVVETEHWLAVVPTGLPGRSKRYCCPKPTFYGYRFDRRPAQRSGAGVEKADQRYDNLFQCSFPYSMGWHGAPLMAKRINTGSCTRTFIRLCSLRHRT